MKVFISLVLALFIATPGFTQQTESRIIGRGARLEQVGAAWRDRHGHLQGHGRHS